MTDREAEYTALREAQSIRRAVTLRESAMRGTSYSSLERFAEYAARAFMNILVDDTASPSVIGFILEVFSQKD